MEEKIREQVALFRFSVIGSLISGELAHGNLAKQIKELCSRRYSIPYSNRTSIGVGTLEEWLYAYRYNGLEGLKPKTRSDLGQLRGMDETLIKTIDDFRAQHPRMPLRIVINKLITENKISRPAKPISTLYRHLRLHSRKRTVPVTGKEQKRFVHRYPNECWQGDVMHGHYIKDGHGPARKTYLVAFVDDATRLITGAQFFFSEETANIKEVLRTAVMTYGVPSKLYLDNGRNFTSHDIELACATMKCALIHSTAYYPEGKGKIERFFRTVRDSFLSGLRTVNSLLELNQAFTAWLNVEYNRAEHSSLNNNTPLDTFLKNAENRIHRLPAHIDPLELFCKKESRLVGKDGTFRVSNILYEAEEHLINTKINVLYDKDDPLKMVKVYDGAVFVHTAKPIDYISNAYAKRKEITERNGE